MSSRENAESGKSSSADQVRNSLREAYIFSGQSGPVTNLAHGVELRQFASDSCLAKGLYTGTVTFLPGADLPYHAHDVSEAATVLSGEGWFEVEGRRYRLGPYECLHVPSGIAHRVVNTSKGSLLVHCAFASSAPAREWVHSKFNQEDFEKEYPKSGAPEHLVRIGDATAYDLANDTRFYDLFAGRFGSQGVCGGYGEFKPGTSLPCHVHDYDESITIVKGEAVCEISGRRHSLSGCDTAFVPRQRPHRFLNESQDLMAMIWVYAGDEPERAIVDVSYCKGVRNWKGR